MSRADQIRTVDDARRLAGRRLPRFLFDAIDRGTSPERTLRDNIAAFEQLEFRPRAAVAVPTVDTSVSVLGHRIDVPVMIAPTGNLRVYNSAGEPEVARAAGSRNTIHIVSCFSGYAIEDVTAAASGPVFFGLLFAGGRDNAEVMIERAAKAGCAALVITVDWGAAHQRERNVKDRLDRPVGFDLRSMLRFGPAVLQRPRWAADFLTGGRRMDCPMWMIDGRPATIWEMSSSILKAAPTWSDLKWIREMWTGPIVLKGILRVDDAQRAADEGVDGIVVSNHGARNVDGSPATMRILPEIADAVGDAVEVYLDSGVRRGADVVKALARGARACLIGRSYVWGFAAAGGNGVARVLDLYKSDVHNTLVSLGCASVDELDPTCVVARL